MIAVEAGLDVGMCPATDEARPCDVRGWLYRTESAYPRAYARCQRCGGWTIVLLPKQDRALFNPPEDDDPVVVDAIEHVLRDPSVKLRLPQLFNSRGITLTAALQEGIEEFILRDIRPQVASLRHLAESGDNNIDWEVDRRVEQRIGLTERRLHSLHRKMERLISQTEEKIRKAIRQERGKLAPKPPRGDILCDARHSLPTIYGLIASSEPDRVRYVGQSMNAGSRYSSHCSEQAAPRVKAWIESLGERPLMILLENCHAVELTDRENYWINHYRGIGMADLNTNIREVGA